VRPLRALLVTALALLAGCSRPGGAAPTASFELVCDSSDTPEFSALFCLRHDTRNGDTRRVDVDKLPRSNGSTRAAEAPAGTYQLVCEATSSDKRSEFFCIRLHTGTGEMLLVGLPKVGVVPAE
jgi:hypothetical protein